MPMMIFILAAGYLFTVYLLLALAKRNGKKASSRRESSSNEDQFSQKRVLRSEVSEVVNSQ
jgi:hypothetical protein